MTYHTLYKHGGVTLVILFGFESYYTISLAAKSTTTVAQCTPR